MSRIHELYCLGCYGDGGSLEMVANPFTNQHEERYCDCEWCGGSGTEEFTMRTMLDRIVVDLQEEPECYDAWQQRLILAGISRPSASRLMRLAESLK